MPSSRLLIVIRGLCHLRWWQPKTCSDLMPVRSPTPEFGGFEGARVRGCEGARVRGCGAHPKAVKSRAALTKRFITRQPPAARIGTESGRTFGIIGGAPVAVKSGIEIASFLFPGVLAIYCHRDANFRPGSSALPAELEGSMPADGHKRWSNRDVRSPDHQRALDLPERGREGLLTPE